MRYLFVVLSLISSMSFADIELCRKPVPSFIPAYLDQVFGRDVILNAFHNDNPELDILFQAMTGVEFGSVPSETSDSYGYYFFLSKGGYKGNYSEFLQDESLYWAKNNVYILEYFLENNKVDDASYKGFISGYVSYAFSPNPHRYQDLWKIISGKQGDNITVISYVYLSAKYGLEESILKLTELYRDHDCSNQYLVMNKLLFEFRKNKSVLGNVENLAKPDNKSE
ncbi:hypothetical protein ACFOEK_17100 [Litoribrevibacter euphylliae]|uniref:Sel1 repeat family protein n=1 Tax=Litoribrevibacter euphylliae TaxID=1834034 RepID=A0ABV7HJA3_9GAMM